jgi:hypothetical protein
MIRAIGTGGVSTCPGARSGGVVIGRGVVVGRGDAVGGGTVSVGE